MSLENDLLTQVSNYAQRHDLPGISSNHVTISFLSRGVYNSNYLLTSESKKFVLRQSIQSQRGLSIRQQIPFEYSILLDLASSNVTAKPLALIPPSKKLQYPILIEQFIPGRFLDYNEDISKAASSLAKIHCFKPKLSKLKRVNAAEALYLEGLKWLQHPNRFINKRSVHKYLIDIGKGLSEYHTFKTLKNAIVNTDLNATNFIINKKCYVIDWECAQFSAVEWDLGHFIAETTTKWGESEPLSKTQIADFIKSYAQKSKIGTEIELFNSVCKLLPYIYFRCFAWALHTYGLNKEASHRFIDSSQLIKINALLNPDFMHQCFISARSMKI